jgi:heme-degrading monooxygenase HmoA
MITVGMEYNVRPGKELDFEKGCQGVVDLLRAEWKGHKVTRLFRDVNTPSSYMIYSEWETFPDFQKFMTSKEFQQVTNWGKEEILDGRPKHTILKDQGGYGQHAGVAGKGGNPPST